MATMVDELRELLTSNMVPKECIDQLEADGCINMKLFSKWAPDRQSMQTLVLDKCATAKTSVQALAALLQTFDECVAIVAEMNRRSSAGIDPEMADEPLLHAVQQALEAKFSSRYSWQLEPKYQPANTMLGRIKREFDRNAPTIFNLRRVRSVFNTNKLQEPKRRKLGTGTGITFTFEQEDEEDPQELRYRHVMAKYDILALAWAIAGNFEVMHEGVKTDMANWQQTRKYVRTLREKTELLMDTFDEQSVVRYLLSVEEQLRGFAVEYCRRSPSVPWGHALEMAMRENKDLWLDFRHLLSGQRGSSSIRSIDAEDLPVTKSVQSPGKTQNRRRDSTVPQSPGQKQHQQQQQQQHQQKKEQPASSSQANLVSTATHTAAGSQICKGWNDSRGCAKPCPNGRSHVCDVVLAKSGTVCGRSDHNRRAHDPARHGQPAPRK